MLTVYFSESNYDWRDEWMGVNSEAGSAVTTTELQNAIHHKLENIPVKGYHLLTTQDLEEITAIWQSPNGVSSSVSINVKIKPSIALEITPENINFGKLSPGETSGLHSLTLKNKGGSDFYITAEIIDTSENLFKDGFLLDSAAWDEYTASLASLESNITNTSLAVPDDYAGIGLKKGELVFWAQT